MVFSWASALALIPHLPRPPRKLKEIHLLNRTKLRYQNRTVLTTVIRLWLERSWPPHSLCTTTHVVRGIRWFKSSMNGKTKAHYRTAVKVHQTIIVKSQLFTNTITHGRAQTHTHTHTTHKHTHMHTHTHKYTHTHKHTHPHTHTNTHTHTQTHTHTHTLSHLVTIHHPGW